MISRDKQKKTKKQIINYNFESKKLTAESLTYEGKITKMKQLITNLLEKIQKWKNKLAITFLQEETIKRQIALFEEQCVGIKTKIDNLKLKITESNSKFKSYENTYKDFLKPLPIDCNRMCKQK